MFDIVGLGQFHIEITGGLFDDDGKSNLFAEFRSDVFTFLATLTKFGATTAMITKLSKDDYGIQLLDYITKVGINCSSITVTDKLPTSLILNTVNPCGKNIRPPCKIVGADSLLIHSDVNPVLLAHTKIIHFTTSSLACEPAASTTIGLIEQYNDKIISYSTNIDQVFWNNKERILSAVDFSINYANILFLEEDDAEYIFEKPPIKVLKEIVTTKDNIKFACLRHLTGGCTIINKAGYTVHRHTYTHDPLDAVEYKNVFQAAIMHGILRSDVSPENISGDELEKIANFACKTAEVFANSKDGFISALPLLQEF